MIMNYLLYGTENFLIKKKIEEIKQEFKIEKNDITEYDLENTNLKNIIDDANTLSLFSNKRLLIIENSYLFTGASKKRDDVKYLEQYLEHKNDNTIYEKANLNR